MLTGMVDGSFIIQQWFCEEGICMHENPQTLKWLYIMLNASCLEPLNEVQISSIITMPMQFPLVAFLVGEKVFCANLLVNCNVIGLTHDG